MLIIGLSSFELIRWFSAESRGDAGPIQIPLNLPHYFDAGRRVGMFDFVAFAIVGFLAQLIDGALGMGYGVICSILLLATGVPPVQTSASVHAAKLFTSGTAGTSHWLNGNVDRKLMIQLAVAGVIGGVSGAILLTHVSSATMRPFIFSYLLIVGIAIWSAASGRRGNRCRAGNSSHRLARPEASSMRSKAAAGGLW